MSKNKNKKKYTPTECEMVVGNYVCKSPVHCLVIGHRIHKTLGVPGVRKDEMVFKCCAGKKCIVRAKEIIQIAYGKEARIQIIDLDSACHRIH